jgi:hypothetical protein
VILRDGGGISMVREQIFSDEPLRDGVTEACEEGSGAEVIIELERKVSIWLLRIR